MEHLLTVFASSLFTAFANWLTVKVQNNQQTSQLQSQIKDVQHTVATQAVTLPVQVTKEVAKAVQAATTPSPSDVKL